MSTGFECFIYIHPNTRSYGTCAQNATLFSGIVVWLTGVAAVANPHCILFALGTS